METQVTFKNILLNEMNGKLARRIASRVIWAVALVATSGVAQAIDFSLPGPFAVGERELTILRPDATEFPAIFLYPATTAGVDAIFDPSGGPYPAVTFGHGFVQAAQQYGPTLAHLASHGYLVVATNSQITLTPDHAAFAEDLRYSLDFLTNESLDPGSPLFGHVAVDRYGASGHSMGAGASLLAAASDPQIRAVANLAASETNPSAIAAMASVNIPVSLITGSADAIVPAATNGQLMYDAAAAPRQLPLILGGSHCGFQDFPFPFFCDVGTITPEQQLATTRRELTAFFDLYLKEDESAWRQVWGPERLMAPGIVAQIDPGVVLIPESFEVVAPRGTTATFTVDVMNTGPVPNSFSLFVDDNLWDVDLPFWQTAVLDPNEAVRISVEVTLPTVPGELVNEFLLSARSNADGLTRGFTQLTVAVPEPSTLALLAVGGMTVLLGRRTTRALRHG